jgi:hypothetical protein
VVGELLAVGCRLFEDGDCPAVVLTAVVLPQVVVVAPTVPDRRRLCEVAGGRVGGRRGGLPLCTRGLRGEKRPAGEEGADPVAARGRATVHQAPFGLEWWAYAVLATANVPVISRLSDRWTFAVVTTANVPHTRLLKRWWTFADQRRRVILTERSEVEGESRRQPAVSIRATRHHAHETRPLFAAAVSTQTASRGLKDGVAQRRG